MPVLTLIVAAVLSAPQFDLQTIGGESAQGSITALDSERVVVETTSGRQELPVKALLTIIAHGTVRPPDRAAVVVELTDGSTLAAKQFTSTAGMATVTLIDGEQVELSLKVLHSVRFVDPTDKAGKLDAAWNEYAASKPAGDLLVIRKKGALDSTDGVVGDVSDETVAFTLDGDKIDVKRTKVEGILYAQTGADELPEAVCAVTSASGSLLQCNTLSLKDGKLGLKTPAGLSTTLPLDGVTKIDFSGGKIVYLSDLEPDAFNYQSYFATDQPVAVLSDFYRLRRNVGLEGNSLRLDGRTYTKGLALHSRSVVAYRLPGKFRLFTATVGIDDNARDGGGDVALAITGDGKSLWKGSVRGNEAAQTLELDVSGIKRLEITADFGEGQDVADHLDLCDAKVMK